MVKSKGKARTQSADPDMTPLASRSAGQPDHDEDMLDVETTRKRGYEEDLNGEPYNGVDTPPSKRRRSKNWPLPAEPRLMALQPPPPLTQLRQASSSSMRSSKFLEGSMNDKTSNKPPSVFTRLFQGSSQGLSVDQLMADYEEDANRPATARPHTRASSSPVKKPQHAPNESVASINTAESKRSGLFRFGRSIAASFNPANIWYKLQNSYKEAEEEVASEEASKLGTDLDDRKAKAEQAYAELKAAGLLKPTKTFVRGSVTSEKTDAETKPRDSGIEMDDARPSLENGDSLHVPRSEASASSASVTRKSPFHFKTPSLADLKRVRSEAQLNSPRTPSYSQSPAKAAFDQDRTIRKQQSKKDMQKQQKLSKRVSDLEAKLEQARRELQQTLAPPVPAFPTGLADNQTPDPRSRSISPLKKSFTPFTPGALPSLPSERLLFPEQLHGNGESKKEETAVPVSQNVEVEKLTEAVEVPQSSIVTADIWTDDFETLVKPNGVGAAPKRKVTKKRKSGDRDDVRYKPESEENDDEEWEAAQAAKKRRASGKAAQKTSPKGKEKMNSTPKKQGGTGRLTKKNTVFNESTSIVTAKVMDEGTIETEETVTITKLPLKDEPSRPTATATPSARPRDRQSRSTSTNKLRRKESHRSLSPASHGRNESPDEVVTVAPDGDSVPPLPTFPKGVKGNNKSREDDGWDGYGEEIF
ncbi:uncharacterized protein BDZ99DRAFT_518946 [Mytilinidion resinicola]|uniref:Nuclear RNA binding protein n=1 Tax=Mytilinidion resinicola TaxID=574789 RepID=A0A6A6YTJ1_9PEZI|nr:uncharacterized protein BDZ99DRAFT_518946 [Mytilinidion resinicola]KAF2811693.1 hypothetical protein BDZ99DRAFT_518946 [Mytilinidion resinicola]